MPACATTNLPRVDDVLASLQVSSHKCKVMYYTEVIGSEDFRYDEARLQGEPFLLVAQDCGGGEQMSKWGKAAFSGCIVLHRYSDRITLMFGRRTLLLAFC